MNTPTRKRPSTALHLAQQASMRTPQHKSSQKTCLMQTPPRSNFRKVMTPSLTRSPSLSLRGSSGRSTPKTSCSSDRFIPNRSAMNVDLCRASVLSAEKHRKGSKTTSRSGENGQPSLPSSNTPQGDQETALQAEFRRRMKGALLNIPLNDISSDSENDTRMLSFSDGNKSFSLRSSPQIPARHVAPIDPYSHDQLRVLQRSAAKDSNGRNMPHSEDADPLGYAGLRAVAQKVGRRIPTAPTRILDAPDMVDDFYINLLSWSKDNVLAVALGQCVYLWDANTGDIQHLVTLRGEDDYVTSVSWANIPGHTKYIAVGTNSASIQLWDAQALKKCRTLSGHSNRVSALSWSHQWLSSGGRDSLILQHDMRSANHVVSTYRGHTQEVCGLKWNEEGMTMASGGNENYLCIWDAAMSRRDARSSRSRRHYIEPEVSPRNLLTQHKAAVKALAWCPFRRGLLASGGGTADRSIKFWNTSNGTMQNSIDTGSQVCSLLWSKHQHELCSSHGFSENQLILWKYPTMTKIQEFKGHTSRVLHMEQSPDGGCVVSAAADETLRFWDVFGSPPSRPASNSFNLGGFPAGIATVR